MDWGGFWIRYMPKCRSTWAVLGPEGTPAQVTTGGKRVGFYLGKGHLLESTYLPSQVWYVLE